MGDVEAVQFGIGEPTRNVPAVLQTRMRISDAFAPNRWLPRAFGRTLVEQVQKVDRMMAVYDVLAVAEQLMSESLSPSRSYLWLIGGFGLTALALSFDQDL